MIIGRIFIGILFLLLSNSCDFTPPLLGEIEEAQKLIVEQRYRDAIVKYEKILNKNLPKDIKIKIYYQLGDLYSIYLAKNEKALEYYKKVKKNTEDPLWLVKTQERIAEIEFSFLKKYRESFKNYDQLARFTPQLEKNDFYEFRRALSLFKMGHLSAAIFYFKKMTEQKNHKHHVVSFYYCGRIDFEREKWESAVKHWGEYVKREKSKEDIVQTKFLMANAYETMEELKKAYNLYYSILGEYPNTEVIQSRLRSIYERRVARRR